MATLDLYGLVGQVLDGQFRVDRAIGEGGFSVVYAGMHLGLDEPVAIKCLKLQHQLGSAVVEGFIRRFRDESKIHYRLSRGSLHIARTIAAGTTMAPATGALVPYMVLEWLDGYTLAEELRARRQRGEKGRSIQEVLRLLDPVADAMAFAHSQGVVHRDLNPSNIFVAHAHGGSKLKVLDFGVAKVISDHALALGPRAVTVGQIRMFTPAYAAPEQFHEALGPIGPHTDVYSFAVMVVELLADRAPIEGEHFGIYADRALDPEHRPTPRSMGVVVGDAVEAVIARAVTVDPSQRPSDVGQFWGMLKNAANRDSQQLRAVGQLGFPKPPIEAAPSAREGFTPRVTAGKLPLPDSEVSVYRPSEHPPSAPPPPAPPTLQQLAPVVDAKVALTTVEPAVPGGLLPKPPDTKPQGAGRYGYFSSRPPPPRWDLPTPPPKEVVESLRPPKAVLEQPEPAPLALPPREAEQPQEAATDAKPRPGPVRKVTLLQGSLHAMGDGVAAPDPNLPKRPPSAAASEEKSFPVASSLSSAPSAALRNGSDAPAASPPTDTMVSGERRAPPRDRGGARVIVTPAPRETTSYVATPVPGPAGFAPPTDHVRGSPHLGDTAQSAPHLRTPAPAPPQASFWQPLSMPDPQPMSMPVPPPVASSKPASKNKKAPLLVALVLALTIVLVVVAIVANQLAR